MSQSSQSSSSQSTNNSRYYIEFSHDASFKNPLEKCYYVEKNDKITFLLDSKKLKNLKPVLLTNIPHKNKKGVVTQPKSPRVKDNINITKQELETKYNHFIGYFNKELSWQCDVEVGDFSGSIQLQLILVDYHADFNNLKVKYFGKVEWIIVQPQLKIKDKQIQMTQLVMQTVLPINLGKAENWPKILGESTNLKYNAFHFAPVQQLGKSQSLYSIKDQLKLNPDIFDQSKKYEQIIDIVQDLQNNQGALSFIDILLNHTSSDSEWLVKCPGSYYNEKTVPHLYSALILDLEIQKFGKKIQSGELEGYNKTTIECEQDLQTIMQLLRIEVLEKLKLEEFFLINIEKTKNEFFELLKKNNVSLVKTEYDVEDADNFFAKSGVQILEELAIENTLNIGAERFNVYVDLQKILEEVKKHPNKFSMEGFERSLLYVNKHWENKCKQYIEDAYSGIQGTIRYEHIERNRYAVNDEWPLVPPYFSKLSNGEYAANNGWIMNLSNVQENFAESHEFYYLRRSIVIWSDLVKLRYGNCKQDSKPLWKRMKIYVQSLAKIFHGFRIDNAHSTPLHVGEYFIRKARNANKNLLVFAELFTGSQQEDALFVKRLGINALVRETVHNSKSDHLYNHLKHIAQNQENYIGTVPSHYEFDVEKGEKMKALVAKLPPPIIYDQTHDNEPIINVHNAPQMMATMALNHYASIFYGTTKGYDELYAEKVDVVNEKRLYAPLGQEAFGIPDKIDKDGYKAGIIYRPQQPLPENAQVTLFCSHNGWKEGIPCTKEGDVYMARFSMDKIGTIFYKFTVDGKWVTDTHKQIQEGNHYFTLNTSKTRTQYSNLAPIRKNLNAITQELSSEYPQIHIKNHGYQVISITREHVSKNKSQIVITRTAYESEKDSDFVNFELHCPGQLDRVRHIYVPGDDKPQFNQYQNGESQNEKEQYFRGQNFNIYEEYNIREFADLFYSDYHHKQILHFYNMKPGTIIILECSLAQNEKEQILQLNKAVNNSYTPQVFELYKNIQPVDINYLLYVCDQEQWERNGSGLYQIPQKGNLKYAGLAGFFHDITVGSLTKNVELPLIHNVMEGNWLVDFIENRLFQGGDNLKPIAEYVRDTFKYLKQIPNQHKAYYFFLINKIFQEQIINKIYADIKLNTDRFKSTFSKNLLLSCFQFIGESKSAQFQNYKYSISAGLPHFSTGWARAWGRDTFIAFRGLLLLPGMYVEAKQIILMFASTLRHGLIPNLLDGGRNSRYNNRDSCWWFIKAIKDYIDITKDVQIWNQSVNMTFLDDSQAIHYKMQQAGEKVEKKLHAIVQEIFQKHASGIRFREWNAGNEIDQHMQSEGFNIQLQLDPETGFIVGGNELNCLTWMDKMGSSYKAGNNGIPATSRNGAPIELTALLKHCLDFVQQQNISGQYPYNGVEVEDVSKNVKNLSFQQWSSAIQQNFEKYYWVPIDPQDPQSKKYAYIKGIYKDLVKSKDPKKEYQLRPNSCIAIAVAPELFKKENAISHIKKCEKYLIEEYSLGIKTLDNQSEDYISYYDNDDDSTRYATSHGYSYHNGPEWVWIYAYYLQALIKLKGKDKDFRSQTIMSYLACHKHHLAQNEWCSLPEMTNANGEFNRFSCPAQAWSIGCILEVYYDLQQKN